MPKRASGSSILHNLPNKSKTSDLQHVNLPFLSAVKNNLPREERSTCYASSLYKNHPNFLQFSNFLFESFFDKYFIAISRFPNIFEQRHLFDDKHRRI